MQYNQAKTFARENRKNPTPAEKLFWSKVRGRKLLGLKINRQYVIEYKMLDDVKHYFVADFYCHQLNLVIEIDGPIHDVSKSNDQERDRMLSSIGYTILRFTNDQVLGNWELIESKLNKTMKKAE